MRFCCSRDDAVLSMVEFGSIWYIIYHLQKKIQLLPYGSVTWRGLSGLDLQEALKMSKILGKIKIRVFLGQVLNLSEE